MQGDAYSVIGKKVSDSLLLQWLLNAFQYLLTGLLLSTQAV